MSMHRLSGCPSCAEPLEEGDRFCGVCGYAVSAPPPSPSVDRPTVPVAQMPGAGSRAAAGEVPGGRGFAGPGAAAPSSTPTGPTAASTGSTSALAGGPGGVGAGAGAVGGQGSTGAGAVGGGYAGPAADGYGSGRAASGGYGSAGASAPGWGSGAGAAPTLVGDEAGWSAGPGEVPYRTPPAQEPTYSTGAQNAPEGDGRAARYDLPGGANTPPEGTPWGPGETPQGGTSPEHEAPYSATPQATGHEDPYSAAPQGTGHEAPYGTTSQGTGHAAPYGATPQGPGHEAPYGAAPQGDGGKTCVACRAGQVDTDGYCEHCGHAQPRERDHLEEELGSVAAVSDRGLRHHRNEDSFAVSATALPDGSAATVAIVCDGVSSASRPDEASAAAAGAANEALLDALPRGAHPQEAMHEAILAAAAAVNALAPETPGAQNAPACTLVGAVVSGGLLTIGWVGDSRAYWVPDDRAALSRRLTEDDSWAAQMVAAGLMGEAEAYADVRAHAITGWLGADAYELEPHTATFKPDHPGVVVVCTDGLWNYAESAQELAQVLPADAAARPLHSAQVLVGHALDGGGHDNVTVAVVPFAAPPSPEAEPRTEAEAEPRTQA